MQLQIEPHSILGMPAIIVSREMTDLMTLVDRVARSNASVLVTGESGSGKELVARSIHYRSMRSKFVAPPALPATRGSRDSLPNCKS